MWVDSPPSKRLQGAMSPGDNDPKPLSFKKEEEPPCQGCKGKGKGKAVFMEEDNDEGSGESSKGDANMNSSIIHDIYAAAKSKQPCCLQPLSVPPSKRAVCLAQHSLRDPRAGGQQECQREEPCPNGGHPYSHASPAGCHDHDAHRGGESMLWLVPILLQPEWKFIVICPFTVLLDEQCLKAQNAGIQAVNYSLSLRTFRFSFCRWSTLGQGVSTSGLSLSLHDIPTKLTA